GCFTLDGRRDPATVEERQAPVEAEGARSIGAGIGGERRKRRIAGQQGLRVVDGERCGRGRRRRAGPRERGGEGLGGCGTIEVGETRSGAQRTLEVGVIEKEPV